MPGGIVKSVRKWINEVGQEFIAEGGVEVIKPILKRGHILSDASNEQLKMAVDPDSEDKRASLLDDIRKMDEAKRRVLLLRLQQAEHGAIPEELGDVSKLTENDLVAALTKIETDEDDRRTGKLEWLVDLSEEEFWAYIDLLWHNPVQQEVDRMIRAGTKIANQVAEAGGEVTMTVSRRLKKWGRRMEAYAETRRRAG